MNINIEQATKKIDITRKTQETKGGPTYIHWRHGRPETLED